MSSLLHPLAVIDPSAQLGEDVRVGPFAVIEADTVLGAGCDISAHAIIKRYTEMGCENRIGEHTVIGGDPQDLGFAECVSRVRMGDNNVVREHVTVHRSSKAGGATTVGNSNLFMVGAHIAHDCSVGDATVFANGATLAGHVHVHDKVFISGYAAIHQFCRVGRLAMISGLVGVNQDILPFTVTAGHPARPYGINRVGLRRAGFSAEEINAVKQAYRLLFASDLTLAQAREQLAQDTSELIQEWVQFMNQSVRGFARARQ